MLDAHQLNVFLVAAETLNFTQAAKRLQMSQPSVSQHIQVLEQHFEQLLFIRAGRRLELTDAGNALVPLARELVSQSMHIEETMESLKGEIHGHLLVGCATTPGKYILPQIFSRFHRLHPKVKVSCQVTSQSQAMQRMRDGEIHFVLTSVSHTAGKYVELHQFMTDHIIMIVPLTHPWAGLGEIEPESLYEGSFVLGEAGSGTQTAVCQALASVGIAEEQLETLLVMNNSEAIALAVEAGLGVGFVSSIIVTRLVQGRVAPVHIHGLTLTRDIYIGRHAQRPATKAQNAFWKFINSEAMLQEINST